MLLYFLKKFVMDLGSVGLWILHRPLYPSTIHQNDNKLNFYKKIIWISRWPSYKIYHHVKIGWGGKSTLVPVKPYVKGKSMYIMWAFNVEKFQN